MLERKTPLGLIGALLVSMGIPDFAFAQQQLVFEEGRAAFDRKDCKHALQKYGEIASSYSDDPLFIHSMAQALECVGRSQEALDYYMRYYQLSGGNSEVGRKIGELRYALAKKQEKDEEVEKRNQARQEKDARARDWTGKWDGDDGRRYSIEQSGTSITGRFASTQALVFSGEKRGSNGRTARGTTGQAWESPAMAKRCGMSSSPGEVDATFDMNSDGSVLTMRYRSTSRLVETGEQGLGPSCKPTPRNETLRLERSE